MGYRARNNGDGTHTVVDDQGNPVPNSNVKEVQFPSSASATKDGDVRHITGGQAVVEVNGDEMTVPLC